MLCHASGAGAMAARIGLALAVLAGPGVPPAAGQAEDARPLMQPLPLSPTGKVDRRALAAIEPRPARAAAGEGSAPPRGPVEELLAGIWQELLPGCAGRALGRVEDFFALGGHSLLATRVAARHDG